MYKPNFKELDKLTEEGYLRKVISPCGKLMLFNYTDKCVYDRKWNKHTLNSRGTVYEIETGKIVAVSFKKFFNFTELPPAKQKTILNGSGKYGTYTAHEKSDGSLNIIYFYDGQWRVNTRGSFTSDQAVKGLEILNEKYDTSRMLEHATYLCEIIYPENKIIVNYGDEEKLVFLGAFNNESGDEVLPLQKSQPFKFAKEYNHSIEEMIKLQETIPKDQEGFVVRFSNGERVKFKGHEYLQIARILKGCSPLCLWEKMSNGKVDEEFIQSIPEEIIEEVEPIIESLEFQYKSVLMGVYSDVKYVRQTLNIPDGTDLTNDVRKEVGLLLKSENLEHEGAIFPFLLRKGEQVEKYTMKQIRPKGNVL